MNDTVGNDSMTPTADVLAALDALVAVHGLSLREIGRQASLSSSLLSGIRTGRTRPSDDVVNRLTRMAKRYGWRATC